MRQPFIIYGGAKTAPDSIYVLQCGIFCKIGITHNARGRLKQIECGNPYEIAVALYALVNGNARDLEKRAHKALANKHHRLEWYKCDPGEAIEKINKISDEHGMTLSVKEIEGSPY